MLKISILTILYLFVLCSVGFELLHVSSHVPRCSAIPQPPPRQPHCLEYHLYVHLYLLPRLPCLHLCLHLCLLNYCLDPMVHAHLLGSGSTHLYAARAVAGRNTRRRATCSSIISHLLSVII